MNVRFLAMLLASLLAAGALAGCADNTDDVDQGGSDAPADGNDTPTDANDTPTDGDTTPIDGNETATGGNETPADGNETLTDNETSANGNETSTESYAYRIIIENGTVANTYSVNVTGTPEGQQVQDAGVYFTTSEEEATSTSTMTSCKGTTDEVPADFTSTCVFPGPGVYYVYAHFKIEDANEQITSFWSSPLVHTVEGEIA